MKLKKVHESTDLIINEDKKRIIKLEKKKLDQFTNYHTSLVDLKDKIKEGKQKEKEKLNNVKGNQNHINRSFVQENKDLSSRLMDKYKKISEKNKNKFIELNEFSLRRKNSHINVGENRLMNKMYVSSLTNNVRDFQIRQNSKSAERNRSNILSREMSK